MIFSTPLLPRALVLDSIRPDEDYPVIKIYTDAYSKCCRMGGGGGGGGGAAAQGIQCTEKDDKWFTRMMNKLPIVSSGNATLYWAHMRKAGGTSLGGAIESATFNGTNKPNAAFTRGFARTVKVHLSAGSIQCVDHQYANESLFVTNVRHPVDRYVSEYFYMNMDHHLGKNLTTREKVLKWYNKSIHERANGQITMKSARFQFIENWQTRWYTNPNQCEDLNRPPPHDSHPNYSYWRSGQGLDPRDTMGSKDMEDAMAVLEKFDVVAMAPYFGGKCDIVPWLVLAGSNKPQNATNEVKNKAAKNAIVMGKREELAGNVTELLGEQVKFDLELFEYAKAMVGRRSAIACCIDDVVGGD